MMKMKNQKGITLVSLGVAVILILIISNIVIYSVTNNLKIEKLKGLQSDISTLRDKVLDYYAKNGTVPVKMKYTSTSVLNGIKSSVMDTGDFYVLDLSALENVTLNNGKDFKAIRSGSVTTTAQANELKDIYIINNNSLNIFYVKGVKIDGETYYTDYTTADVDETGVTLH